MDDDDDGGIDGATTISDMASAPTETTLNRSASFSLPSIMPHEPFVSRLVEDDDEPTPTRHDDGDEEENVALLASSKKQKTSPSSTTAEHKQFLTYLYISHACAAWGERMWDFLRGLLLLTITGGTSLRWTAALSLSESLAQFAVGPSIGDWVDRQQPLHAPTVAYAVQNLSIAASASCAYVALSISGESSFHIPVALLVIATATAAKLGSVASTIAVEKRWVIALCSAHDDEVLTTTNATMRRIDLTCKIVAPLLAGIIMSSFGERAATVACALFNIAAWPAEVVCLRAVYRASSHLFTSREEASSSSTTTTTTLSASWGHFLLYARQSIFPSTLALALLYFTVLSFGSLMTAYVYWAGLSATATGVAQSGSALFGIAATFLAPALMKRVESPKASGTLFIWLQNVCILPAVIALLVAAPMGNATSANAAIYILMVSVVVSRVGLWGFDLSVTQLLQKEVVPAEAVGTVSGVQVALQALFGAGIYVLGMVLDAPRDFPLLAFASYLVVTLAAALHTWGWLRKRGEPSVELPPIGVEL